jgi:hypothetical protein
MRSDVVVFLAIRIELLLGMRKIFKDLSTEEVLVQGSMKAFILPNCLRVIVTGVDQLNLQSHQPGAEAGETTSLFRSPGRAIIDQEPSGKPIPTENTGKLLSDRLSTLISTGSKSETVAGMIIKQGQRMTADCIGQWKMTLEIHLPEIIRRFGFKTLPGPPFSAFFRIDQAMPA